MGRCVQGELLLRVLGGNPALLTGPACSRRADCWPGKGTLLSRQVCRARLTRTNAYSQPVVDRGHDGES